MVTCTAAATSKYAGVYGTAAMTAVYRCHEDAIKSNTPSVQNLLPYMLSLLKCGLASAVPGAGVIASDITTCVAGYVNQKLATGGK